jgi:hypothetical protein
MTIVILFVNRVHNKPCDVYVDTLDLSEAEKKKKRMINWALVSGTCNPSNLGGRDQEDLCFTGQTVGETLFQKYPTQNRAGRWLK